jgi:hypothetical protein
MNNLVTPLKRNGEIITLQDQKYGIKKNWCSHYLWKQKVLLMEGVAKNFFAKNKRLILGYSLEKKKVKCKYLSLINSVFCLNGFRLLLNVHPIKILF